MARIRSIKPEFPQSESMGRVSRDARLLFLQLFTLVDDGGRTRAASRLLASLLYPYDEDAPDLIESWLEELEQEGCIQCYVIGVQSYLQITKWSEHQKIDKPTSSKLPSPPEIREDSRALASPREDSAETPVQSRGVVGGLDWIGKDLKEEVPELVASTSVPLSAVRNLRPDSLTDVDLHSTLPSTEWGEWLEHRRRKRWPVDGMTLRKQLKVLARHDTETQREMLNTSIQAGWQGIFAPKGGKAAKPKKERGFQC